MSEAEMSSSPPPPRSKWPRLSLRWYESWIVRAAALAALVLFCGYLVNFGLALQGIDSLARLAHDGEVETALGDLLERIKMVHSLEQELLLERLKPLVLAATAQAPKLSTEDLRALVIRSGAVAVSDAKALKITKLGAHLEREDVTQPLRWLDRERLKIFDFIVEFPRGAIYEDFKAAESVRQRYELLGVNMQDEIRPTIVRTNLVVFFASFLLLASTFFWLARRFSARIRDVMTGFHRWSDEDPSFRFTGRWSGELKLITSQFNAMADDVEANRQRSLYLEKIASWQIIARKLAHEIKNPLTPIQMMVSQLKRRYDGSDEAFRQLLDEAQTIISEEVAGLKRLVDTFSHFARLPRPNPLPVDLITLARRVVELQKAAYPHHDINVNSSFTNAIAEVDEDLIRQVLLNLVKNAAEACGERPSHITVGVEDEGTHLTLAVTDDGPGIPRELLTRVFEAYFTTKHTGPTPGMGLGLAVCQKIVIDHGGEINVKSRPGKTTFYLRLPKVYKERQRDQVHAGT